MAVGAAVWLDKPLISGASLTALTVKTKPVEAELRPSVAVMLMMAVPLPWSTGVIVATRLLPEPLKTMFAAGTNPGLEEVAERTKVVPGALVTVKATFVLVS